MHRLRCIITADRQMLFNQVYVNREFSFSLSLENKKEGQHCITIDLSYPVQWYR